MSGRGTEKKEESKSLMTSTRSSSVAFSFSRNSLTIQKEDTSNREGRVEDFSIFLIVEIRRQTHITSYSVSFFPLHLIKSRRWVESGQGNLGEAPDFNVKTLR